MHKKRYIDIYFKYQNIYMKIILTPNSMLTKNDRKKFYLAKITSCVSHHLKKLIILLLVIFTMIVHVWSPYAFAFSIGEEKEYGEELLVKVRKELKIIEEPDIVQYINHLGTEVLSVAGPQYFSYQFFIINNKEFNAFAAPASLIFFNSGLIKVVEHENELVSVMAHEIGHSTSRHIAENQDKQFRNTLLTLPLLLGGIAMGGGALSQGLIYGSMATGESMSLIYSREFEEEADRLALQWMLDLGRDPQYMVSMLEKMRRISILQSSGNTPAYLLSHPKTEERLSYIEDLILFNNKTEYRKINDFAYLRFKCRVLALTEKEEFLHDLYQRAISASDQSADETLMGHYGMSLYYLHEKEFSKARESLQKVIAIYPDNVELVTDMGVILFKEGQKTKALQIMNKAVQANPKSAYASYYLATILENTGDLHRAASLYESVVENIPNFQPVYQALGNLKITLGEEGVGHYYLGFFYWVAGDLNKAGFHFAKAFALLDTQDIRCARAQEMLEKVQQRGNKNT